MNISYCRIDLERKDDYPGSCLSANTGAIHLLEKNLGKINWDPVCMNPSIFEKNDLFIYETLWVKIKHTEPALKLFT